MRGVVLPWPGFESACKHRVAVALWPATVESAGAEREGPLLAAGGQPESLTEMSTPTGDVGVHWLSHVQQLSHIRELSTD